MTIIKGIIWWELRRPIYNLYLALIGAIGWILLYYSMGMCRKLEPGEDLVEPVGMLLGLLLANVGYSAYLIFEIYIVRGSKYAGLLPRERVFLLGLGITTVVAILPSVLWFGICVSSIL